MQENMLAENELIFLLQENFNLIHLAEKEIFIRSNATEIEIIQELSLWYDNPYSAVQIKNLKV